MNTTIKAHFKQATVKGGVAVLQLEVLTDAAGASTSSSRRAAPWF